MVREVPINNDVTQSQTATISLRGDVRVPNSQGDQQQLQNVSSTTNGNDTFRPTGQPSSEGVEFSQWDGTLCQPTAMATNQVQRAVYSRPTHGGSAPDSSKSYRRLSNVSAVVPLSGLSPFSAGFARDSSFAAGHRVGHDQPNFPTSGESVISYRTAINGATLSFHHIRYEVKMKKMPWSRAVTRTVLDDVRQVPFPNAVNFQVNFDEEELKNHIEEFFLNRHVH